MSFFSVLLLGLAVSFDGFGAGFACGVRNTRIPMVSLLIICLSSAISMYLSMAAGVLLAGFLSFNTASAIGGFILLGVGVIIIAQTLCRTRPREEAGGEGKERHGLCLLSSLLRKPELADLDSSGAISGKEAVILGVALAMDAFAAGFGAAMSGFAPLATASVVGAAKFVLLPAGVVSGRRFSRAFREGSAALVAGAVLVMLGLTRLL